MASSDSTRKVARVANRSATSGPKQSKNWLFPVAIVAIVALGVGIVFIARGRNEGYGGNSTPPRAQLAEDSAAFDHWHAAFAINICGTELPANADIGSDKLGIHTHQDGLIHIHPFSVQAAGKRATLQRFFDQIGREVSNDKGVLPVEYGLLGEGFEPRRGVLEEEVVGAPRGQHHRDRIPAPRWVPSRADGVHAGVHRRLRPTSPTGSDDDTSRTGAKTSASAAENPVS